MFRRLRVAALVALLVAVALGFWLERQRLAAWADPVWVAVYPINADGAGGVGGYIARLEEDDFAPIERYFAREAADYGLDLPEPIEVKLAPRVRSRPPTPPANGNVIAVMFWSLRLRFWAWRHDTFEGPAEVQLFVLYHDARPGRRLAHSLGLEKGRIGVVNAFGSRRLARRNRVVIAHELLHTLGASDKYDPATGRPRYPEGFAEPEREPRYPQRMAELMGGYVPLGPRERRMPRSLAETVVGPATAAEIGWLR